MGGGINLSNVGVCRLGFGMSFLHIFRITVHICIKFLYYLIQATKVTRHSTFYLDRISGDDWREGKRGNSAVINEFGIIKSGGG